MFTPKHAGSFDEPMFVTLLRSCRTVQEAFTILLEMFRRLTPLQSPIPKHELRAFFKLVCKHVTYDSYVAMVNVLIMEGLVHGCKQQGSPALKQTITKELTEAIHDLSEECEHTAAAIATCLSRGIKNGQFNKGTWKVYTFSSIETEDKSIVLKVTNGVDPRQPLYQESAVPQGWTGNVGQSSPMYAAGGAGGYAPSYHDPAPVYDQQQFTQGPPQKRACKQPGQHQQPSSFMPYPGQPHQQSSFVPYPGQPHQPPSLMQYPGQPYQPPSLMQYPGQQQLWNGEDSLVRSGFRGDGQLAELAKAVATELATVKDRLSVAEHTVKTNTEQVETVKKDTSKLSENLEETSKVLGSKIAERPTKKETQATVDKSAETLKRTFTSALDASQRVNNEALAKIQEEARENFDAMRKQNAASAKTIAAQTARATAEAMDNNPLLLAIVARLGIDPSTLPPAPPLPPMPEEGAAQEPPADSGKGSGRGGKGNRGGRGRGRGRGRGQ